MQSSQVDSCPLVPWLLSPLVVSSMHCFVSYSSSLCGWIFSIFLDASTEEILSAFSLAEQVRGLAKKVSPTLWDPTKVALRQRAEIQELRAQLLFRNSHSTQDSMIGQLQRALRELQVGDPGTQHVQLALLPPD